MWLVWFCLHMQPSSKVFTLPLEEFRSIMSRIAAKLDVSALKYTPSSLRAGKATEMFLEGASLDTIKFAGGWSSISTLEHYVQEAAVVRCASQLSVQAQATLRDLLSEWPVVPEPPQSSFLDVLSRYAPPASAKFPGARKHPDQ